MNDNNSYAGFKLQDIPQEQLKRSQTSTPPYALWLIANGPKRPGLLRLVHVFFDMDCCCIKCGSSLEFRFQSEEYKNMDLWVCSNDYETCPGGEDYYHANSVQAVITVEICREEHIRLIGEVNAVA